jgi:RecA/RadA recombinase
MVKKKVEIVVTAIKKKPAKKAASKSPAKKAGRVSKLKAFAAVAKKRWQKSISVGSDIPLLDCPRLSTGNFGLDIATFGGLPPGTSMFWGTPRSTKTGSSLNAAAEWQKRCAFCYQLTCKCRDREPAGVLWVDAEGKTSDSIMIPWMRDHGICMDSLLIERPDSGNEIVDVVDAAIRSGIKFIVVDSIANLTVKDEIKKAAEDGITPGRGAMLGNSAMRKWTQAQVQWGFSDDIPARVLLINQIRMTFNQYAPEALPGGIGQKYAIRLGVRFHSTKSRRRYRVTKEDGTFTDLQKAPNQDSIPNYQETDYRLTDTSQCPPGRYGSFNYWMTNAHGRRKGDPDNVAQMVVYMRRYKFFQKSGKNWCIKVPEDWIADTLEAEEFCHASKQEDVMEIFRLDLVVQAMVWSVFIRELTKG